MLLASVVSRRLCLRLLGASGQAGAVSWHAAAGGAAAEVSAEAAVPAQQQLALLAKRLFATKPPPSKQQKPGKQHNKQPQRSKKQALLQQQTAVDKRATPAQIASHRSGAVAGHQRSAGGSSSPKSSSSSSSSSRPWQVSGSIPQPTALVLPDLTASAAAAAAGVTPRLGRVPPSSSAAAAAAASFLNATQPPAGTKGRRRDAAATAAAAAAESEGPRLVRHRRRRAAADFSSASNSTSTNPQQDPSASAAPAPAPIISFDHLIPPPQVLPWDVVAALRQSCTFSLERLAHGGLTTYIAYLKAARLGMPSVFDLGIVREQGYAARRHLLQRERVLGALVQQLQPPLNAESGSGGSSGGSASPWALGQQQQQEGGAEQQQQQPISVGPWCPSDEQLEVLSEEQLAAAAAAAAAVAASGSSSSGAVLSGCVTVQDVTECLVDYFVFKRCMETLLLQRQHRLALKDKHERLMQQQLQQQAAEEGQQQGQQQQGQKQRQHQQALTLLTSEELSEVRVWDAFFDATLKDYILYLESAALGVPSVFTIARDSVFPHSQEHQQQHDQKKRTSDFQAACEAAGVAAATLSLLNKQQVRLPGHITREQLVGLAQQLKEPDATADLQDVVQLFSDFGEAKRMAFREVLDELLGAAGAAAASTKGRF